MTVGELKEALEQYPDNMPVKKYCYQGEYSDPNKDIEYLEQECCDWRGNDIEPFVSI